MDRHSIGDPKQRRNGLYATERSRLLEKYELAKNAVAVQPRMLSHISITP
jgi:hypothetical protein